MLANKELDAVLLSLPIHLNAQIILDAARAGKHVICKKPLAANWEQAVTLVKALENVPVLVESPRTTTTGPTSARPKSGSPAGRIGNVFLVQVTQFGWTDINKGFASTPGARTTSIAAASSPMPASTRWLPYASLAARSNSYRRWSSRSTR